MGGWGGACWRAGCSVGLASHGLRQQGDRGGVGGGVGAPAAQGSQYADCTPAPASIQRAANRQRPPSAAPTRVLELRDARDAPRTASMQAAQDWRHGYNVLRRPAVLVDPHSTHLPTASGLPLDVELGPPLNWSSRSTLLAICPPHWSVICNLDHRSQIDHARLSQPVSQSASHSPVQCTIKPKVTRATQSLSCRDARRRPCNCCTICAACAQSASLAHTACTRLRTGRSRCQTPTAAGAAAAGEGARLVCVCVGGGCCMLTATNDYGVLFKTSFPATMEPPHGTAWKQWQQQGHRHWGRQLGCLDAAKLRGGQMPLRHCARLLTSLHRSLKEHLPLMSHCR